MTWPWAVFGCVVVFCVWALVDTWLKQPYLRRKVGDLEVTARGEQAVTFVTERDDERPGAGA